MVGYAFSPIDLIPDFVPILGYVDDLVFIPLGIALLLKIIPSELMGECRQRAAITMAGGKQKNWIAAAVIVAIWLGLAALSVRLVMRAIGD